MSSSSYAADILILGATGSAGYLSTKYLSTHPQRSKFTFAIAARSPRKLEALATELVLDTRVPLLVVDVLDVNRLEAVIHNFKVVINAVGPYWKYGTPIVLACARAGTHYVDVNGEIPWTKHIIKQLGDIPTHTGSIIVPSCGFAAAISDLSAFSSVMALRSKFGPDILACRSVTALELKAGHKSGFSNGTLLSAVGLFEDVPRGEFLASFNPYYLSPLKGAPKSPFQLYYTLPACRPPILGAFFSLAVGHTAVVDRTWGLLELRKSEDDPNRRRADDISYGPNFVYTECLIMPSVWLAVMASLCFMGFIILMFIPPVRWLFKRMLAQDPAEQPGPGYSQSINVTEGVLPQAGESLKYARSTFRIKVDPFYVGSSALVSECALGLLLTPRSQLPNKGNVLTPVAALGSILVERLKATDICEIESEILSEREAQRRPKYAR